MTTTTLAPARLLAGSFEPFCVECGVRLPAVESRAVACPCCGSDLVPRRSAGKEPWIAAALSLVLPGAGQVYNGHFFRGVLVLGTCWLIVPWIFGIIDAWRTARRHTLASGSPGSL